MADVMHALIDDLAAEQEALDAALAATADADWENPSPAEGWRLRDCIAHLAEVDETAAVIAETGAYPQSDGPPREGVLSGRQLQSRRLSRPELVGWWRAARARMNAALRTKDAKERLPWVGPPMSARSFATARLMECWSHGLDALAAAGIEPLDSDRLRHVAHLGLITREFAYRNRGLEPPPTPLRVELEAPTGAIWAWGPVDAPDRISGLAGEFCRVVTQRLHPADTQLRVEGEAAREFLHVAQAFAGPPGSGRPPSA